MKTLKDLFELYRPKAKGEQDFVDKHVVIKHKDRNGNGDDVFNGNTKVVDRKKNRQGYDTSSDEKVYEEVTHRVHGYYDAKTSRGYDTRPVSIKVKADNEDHAKKVAAQQLANHKNYKPTKVVSLGEEVEGLDEAVSVSHDRYLRSHGKKASGAGAWIFTHKKYGNIDLNDDKSSHIGKGKFSDAAKSAKAWAKKHGHMTIYVAEEHADEMLRTAILEMAEIEGEDLTEERVTALVEEMIDELSRKTLSNYVKKASPKVASHTASQMTTNDIANMEYHGNKVIKRLKGINTAASKLAKEEVEALDELSRKTLGSYVKKASPSASAALATAVSSNDKDNAISAGKRFSKRSIGIDRAINKLTKEDVINRAIDKYVVSESELPTPTERLISKIDGLSESHIHTLLGLFESLNEDNQTKMLETISTHEGIISLLDFAIANKGE